MPIAPGIAPVGGTTFGGVRNHAIPATTAGNMLVAVVLHQSSGALTVASTGAAWVRAVTSEVATASGQYKIDIWYALKAPSTTSVSFTASPNSALAPVVSEYSGVKALRAVDAKYTKALSEAGAGVTVNPGDLAIAGISYYSTTDTATPAVPFLTLGRTGTSTSRMAAAYHLPTAAGPAIAGWEYAPEGSPGVYDRATVMAVFSPVGPSREFRIKRGGVSVPIQVRAKRTVPAAPIDSNAQKMDADHIPIQSLNLVNSYSLREAFTTKNGNGKFLSGPTGIFEDSDFSRSHKGMVSIAGTGWRGFSGSGADTIVRLKPNSSTVASSEIPNIRDQGTNPFYLISALTPGLPQKWERFTFGPGAGHLHGGIQSRTENADLTWQDLVFNDLAPGDDWTPPGETFGFNAWHCYKTVTVKNITGDAKNRGSSPVGFNSSRNILLEDFDVRNSPWGMPTFWQCTNYTTRRVKVYGGHMGINQEQVAGVIEHYSPEIFPNRDWIQFRDGRNNAGAMHMTFQSNNPAYIATVMRVFDPIVDTGRSSAGTARNGALMIMKSKNYTVQEGSGQLQKDSAIEVYKTINGSLKQLALLDMDNTGGVVADPDKNFCVFR
ncbi:hypothetical protein PTW37_06570 [Arthrobacter agilis]|uniref:hypothetical protein n=1 Tax=Arthrobacter agilis TaxID=37921 RepID=UPI00236521FF|nr:hypothetical protein [Arthrobacter agilis]WDF34558.1 hypothetical protein PTW37_06570 [Arthrobacter agilis]